MNVTRYLVGAGVLLSFCATPVFATLIDFDDLPADYQLMPPWSYEYPDDMWEDDGSVWTSRPLTDQYVDLGVSFGTGDLNEIAAYQASESGAGLITREDVVVSGPNAVGSHYTYDGLRFSFVGDERPEYLSFYASAPSGAMTVYVREMDGTTQELRLGWSLESGEFEYTERPMKQKVEFLSEGSSRYTFRISTVTEQRLFTWTIFTLALHRYPPRGHCQSFCGPCGLAHCA